MFYSPKATGRGDVFSRQGTPGNSGLVVPGIDGLYRQYPDGAATDLGDTQIGEPGSTRIKRRGTWQLPRVRQRSRAALVRLD